MIDVEKIKNRLVHFYNEVTIPELYDIIQNHLKDFEIFIQDITEILKEA